MGLPEGVWVTNSGDVSQRVLAGHAIALMLGVMRGFRRFEPLRAQRDWARQTMPRHMIAPDGARMVILGMGRIGQDIARKAKAFDMEVICVTRAPAPAVPEIDRVVPREKVDEVLPTADVVMIAMPLDAGTQGFLSAARIALMKETAVLVNISRGKVVDEVALARALAEGRIMGAGLDAFAKEPLPAASPLWDLPNVLMTPHVGGNGGRELWRRMSELVRDNTRRYLSGAPLKHVVRTTRGTLQGLKTVGGQLTGMRFGEPGRDRKMVSGSHQAKYFSKNSALGSPSSIPSLALRRMCGCWIPRDLIR